MPLSISDLQDRETGRIGTGSNQSQMASDQAFEQYQHADQRNESGQPNLSGTHNQFHHTFVNCQYAAPPYNSNTQVHERYRMSPELSINEERFAAEPDHAFYTATESSVNAVEAHCGSDTVSSIPHCGQALSAMSMHSLNEARRWPGLVTETYDPMEHWKRQSFRDSPWSNIDYPLRTELLDSLWSNIDYPLHTELLGPQDHQGVDSMTLDKAVSSMCHEEVYQLLARNFDQVAVGGYSWLWEVKQLGYAGMEMADLLLAKASDTPWIYFEEQERRFAHDFNPNFHLPRCVHQFGELGASDMPLLHFDSETVLVNEITERTIQELCGLAGVVPYSKVPRATTYGLVEFSEESSTATVTFGCVNQTLDQLQQRTYHVFLRFAAAIKCLQRAGGCCNSFTVLLLYGGLEMSRISLQGVDLILSDLQSLQSSTDSLKLNKQNLDSIFSHLDSLSDSAALRNLVLNTRSYVETEVNNSPSHPTLQRALQNILHLYSLVAQFLCLAFLSYTYGHCGPIRPFFLDTPQRRVVLLGSQKGEAKERLPAAEASLVDLTCMSEMTQGPVFAFRLFSGSCPCNGHCESHCDDTDSDLGHRDWNWNTELPSRFNLTATPEDLLDTWGPGQIVTDPAYPERVYAICIGGGNIWGIGAGQQTVYHWSHDWPSSETLTESFNYTTKISVGAQVRVNSHCLANNEPGWLQAPTPLHELGTHPSYWQVSQRQGGLQGGQYIVTQFNQTWVKTPGRTKKLKLVSQQAVFVPDLEIPFGVQVSYCTGIARRVPLRELLADILPSYIASLVVKPPLWEELVGRHILEYLRGPNLRDWLCSLSYEQQKTFQDLVLGILFLLKDTGLDRTGEHFVVAYIRHDLPFQCFKVPCKKESYWAKILADSEDIATFAYITLKCLETDTDKCRGPSSVWTNSIVLLGTAVSCQYDRAITTSPIPWELRHVEGYLIGKRESPLFVLVDRPTPQTEPRLLVSASKIPPPYLCRLYIKRKPRLLCERRSLDQHVETAVVLVGLDGPVQLIKLLKGRRNSS